MGANRALEDLSLWLWLWLHSEEAEEAVGPDTTVSI